LCASENLTVDSHPCRPRAYRGKAKRTYRSCG
jgi:hypothetical protein